MANKSIYRINKLNTCMSYKPFKFKSVLFLIEVYWYCSNPYISPILHCCYFVCNWVIIDFPTGMWLRAVFMFQIPIWFTRATVFLTHCAPKRDWTPIQKSSLECLSNYVIIKCTYYPALIYVIKACTWFPGAYSKPALFNGLGLGPPGAHLRPALYWVPALIKANTVYGKDV